MGNKISHEKTNNLGFRPGLAQTDQQARSLKFQIYKEEGLYYMYLCSESKDADQLCLCMLFVFLCSGSNVFYNRDNGVSCDLSE